MGLDRDELPGHLVDLLNSYPQTRDLPDTDAVAAAVAPILLNAAGTALGMLADDLEYEIENPEMPWSQGVLHACDALRAAARDMSPPLP